MFTSLVLASIAHFAPLPASMPMASFAAPQASSLDPARRSGNKRRGMRQRQAIPFAGDLHHEGSKPEPKPSANGKKGLGLPGQAPSSPKEPTPREEPSGNETPEILGGPRGGQKPGTAGSGSPGGSGSETEPLGEPHGGVKPNGHETEPISTNGISVTPEEGLVSVGPVGGAFYPQDAEYLLTNSSSTSTPYSISVDAPFVHLSDEGGFLAPGASTTLWVTLDPTLTASLPLGTHAATVSITDLSSGSTSERDILLSVHPAGSRGLVVTPPSGLTSTGPEGGAFAPVSRTFQLRNSSSQPLSFQAQADMSWIVLSQSSGQIAPGQAMSLQVGIEASVVMGYLPGTYVGEVSIADLSNGQTEEREVKLTITSASSSLVVTQLTQFGITWYFDRAYSAGQFANGDYWVVGPVSIIDIDPASNSVNGRITNGSMVNPSPMEGTRQGYDSSMYAQYRQPGDFDNAMNVAFGISPTNPLKLAPHSSLVSTISETEANLRPQIRTCAILTVLPKPALTGDFRPPYCGKNKSIQFNEGQLDYSLLKRLPIPAAVESQMVSLEEAERMFERAWLDHVPLWIGRYTHPSENMPDYGREIVDNVSIAAILLHLDLDPTLSTVQLNAMKRELLVRFTQLGIDFYGIAMDGGSGNWRSAAGHMSGRKWPILFAGLMLSDPDMSEIGMTKQIRFGEDDQTFVVSQDEEGLINQGYGNYTQNDLGKPEWGTNHPMQPWFDDNDWFGDPYRLCCTSNAWWGQLLAAHIMGATDEWNHDVLFDYQDRFLQENEERYGVTDWRLSWRRWYLDLWKVYRPQY